MANFVLCLLCLVTSVLHAAIPGYHFTEGHSHTSLAFKLYKNLIIIPSQLNDTLPLHLILDTGTRSIILYGKRFKHLRNIITDKKLQLSGWGSSGMVDVKRSFPNSISIGEVKGEGLCAAVVDHRKLFEDRPDIDGIIGYEIFARFAVEIDYQNKVIHLYDKIDLANTQGLMALPLDVNQARPEILSTLEIQNGKPILLNLLIDTGSSLGLTVFSKEVSDIDLLNDEKEIGIGLAGSVYGYDVYIRSASIGGLHLSHLHSHLVHVRSHPDQSFTRSGSLGADFLKDYRLIFDYPTNKLYLKKQSKVRSRK